MIPKIHWLTFKLWMMQFMIIVGFTVGLYFLFSNKRLFFLLVVPFSPGIWFSRKLGKIILDSQEKKVCVEVARLVTEGLQLQQETENLKVEFRATDLPERPTRYSHRYIFVN